MGSKYMTFHVIAFCFVFIVYFCYIYYCMTVSLCGIHTSSTIISITPHSKLFQNYLAKYDKYYEGHEFKKRLDYFMENLREIHKLNKNSGNARYGITKFADMSREEFERTMLLGSEYFHTNCELIPNYYINKTCDHSTPIKSFKLLVSDYLHTSKAFKDNVNIPPAFDWRVKGVVGPVLDQKRNCNGCWAFSIVGVMESMVAIKKLDAQTPYGSVTRLSIQELMDCSRLHSYSNGCEGGDPDLALKFLCEYNIPISTEDLIPLKLRDDICRVPRNGVKLNWMAVECNVPVNKIAEVIATHGPVIAAVSPWTWRFYHDGIIQRHCNGDWSQITHVVQIVGYNQTSDIPYFIVKNSWGSDFGDNGFLKIAMENFMCGVGRQIAYLKVDLPSVDTVDEVEVLPPSTFPGFCVGGSSQDQVND